MFVLTWHIFETFGGESIRPPDRDTIPIFYGIYVFFAVVMVIILFLVLRSFHISWLHLILVENIQLLRRKLTYPTIYFLSLQTLFIFRDWKTDVYDKVRALHLKAKQGGDDGNVGISVRLLGGIFISNWLIVSIQNDISLSSHIKYVSALYTS